MKHSKINKTVFPFSSNFSWNSKIKHIDTCLLLDNVINRVLPRKKTSHEAGYTLVETLIALTMVLLLLFLVNDLLPVLLLKAGDHLKLQAITEARNQMEETFLLRDFSDDNKELPNNLILKRKVEDRGNLMLIIITVSAKDNNVPIYRLKSYAQKRTDNPISGVNR
jgi:hypothetical protein